jgi:hypothetical protein
MIEGRSPPGVMAVLDDTSLTMNAVSFSFFFVIKKKKIVKVIVYEDLVY